MDAVINFFKEFSSMLPTIKVMDIVDILVVAFLIYKVIMMVRSTSAARIAKSVLIILILAGVTQLLNMYLLNYILDKILEIGLVALIVVFQPELRRMLEKLGSKNVRGSAIRCRQMGEALVLRRRSDRGEQAREEPQATRSRGSESP